MDSLLRIRVRIPSGIPTYWLFMVRLCLLFWPPLVHIQPREQRVYVVGFLIFPERDGNFFCFLQIILFIVRMTIPDSELLMLKFVRFY